MRAMTIELSPREAWTLRELFMAIYDEKMVEVEAIKRRVSEIERILFGAGA